MKRSFKNREDAEQKGLGMTSCVKRGFTLIELLVVVLIIGILAAIAVPQYTMAVNKSRVVTMIPLMKRWYDALAMYKMENGAYCFSDAPVFPTADMLGVSFPEDWECTNDGECWNEMWDCFPNEECSGYVYCNMIGFGNKEGGIIFYQPDDPDANLAGKKVCYYDDKICKALGGRPIEGYEGFYEIW